MLNIAAKHEKKRNQPKQHRSRWAPEIEQQACKKKRLSEHLGIICSHIERRFCAEECQAKGGSKNGSCPIVRKSSDDQTHQHTTQQKGYQRKYPSRQQVIVIPEEAREVTHYIKRKHRIVDGGPTILRVIQG